MNKDKISKVIAATVVGGGIVLGAIALGWVVWALATL